MMKFRIFLMVFGVLFTLCNCQPTVSNDTSKIERGMIKVTVLYPNEEGRSFDMSYYAEKHMPMVASLFGEVLKKYAIDRGIAGRTPDDSIPYQAIGYFYFDQLSDYEKAFGPNAETILRDIPNYTDIQPIVQISEVLY